MELPYVVLWRPEALDSRVLIPPEAWSGLTRNPPSLGFEPQTSCILSLAKSSRTGVTSQRPKPPTACPEHLMHSTTEEAEKTGEEPTQETLMTLFLRVSSPQREGRPRTEAVRFQRRRCNLQLSRNAVVCYLWPSLSGNMQR